MQGAVSACLIVYQDFFSYGGGVYHHVAGDLAGGHCISIIGFDDVEWWPYLATPLTSVNVPGAELGRAAAMLLLSRLQNIAPATPERVLLPANLVLRESTAAPAKRSRSRVRG